MTKLLPDHLKELWRAVEERHLTTEQFTVEEDRLIDDHRRIWEKALVLASDKDLRENLLWEIGQYFRCEDLDVIETRCRGGLSVLEAQWRKTVARRERASIERFYDAHEYHIYDLMWWHTLCEDNSPLAYVVALQLAQDRGCRTCLDFGAGVGSGAILFGRHGFDVTLADISSTLLHFSRWRLDQRGMHSQLFDLKMHALPPDAFDLVTAMDVFEHLCDPLEAVEDLSRSLKSGGFLFGRFHAEPDEQRSQHIVFDFGPTFRRLRDLGFVEVWRDEWLWGHQLFQKK